MFPCSHPDESSPDVPNHYSPLKIEIISRVINIGLNRQIDWTGINKPVVHDYSVTNIFILMEQDNDVRIDKYTCLYLWFQVNIARIVDSALDSAGIQIHLKYLHVSVIRIFIFEALVSLWSFDVGTYLYSLFFDTYFLYKMRLDAK